MKKVLLTIAVLLLMVSVGYNLTMREAAKERKSQPLQLTIKSDKQVVSSKEVTITGKLVIISGGKNEGDVIVKAESLFNGYAVISPNSSIGDMQKYNGKKVTIKGRLEHWTPEPEAQAGPCDILTTDSIKIVE